MKPIAIVLSGCGVFDGSEIHEAVCALLALDEANASVEFFAPDINQTRVFNHFTQQTVEEKRSVLAEAARIARGKIKDIRQANVEELAAAIYPGGFGAALNLSDFGLKHEGMTVQPDVLHFAQAMAKAEKPQGFICIAPTLIPQIYGPGIQLTIGDDKDTATAIESMGGKHVTCSAADIVIDKQHKVVTTPAYMLAKRVSDVRTGIKKLVDAVLSMT